MTRTSQRAVSISMFLLSTLIAWAAIAPVTGPSAARGGDLCLDWCMGDVQNQHCDGFDCDQLYYKCIASPYPDGSCDQVDAAVDSCEQDMGCSVWPDAECECNDP